MNRKYLILLFLGIFVPLVAADRKTAHGHKFNFGEFDGNAQDVAFVRALANTDEYIGRKIRVTGVYLYEFDGSYLFLSREALEGYDYPSAIELPINESELPGPIDQLEEMNGSVVAIEGTLYRVANRLVLKKVTRIFLKSQKPSVRATESPVPAKETKQNESTRQP